LELHKIGEVCEDEVLNAQWLANLARNGQYLIPRELDQANERIALLEGCLDSARAELGEQPAANDREVK